MSRTISQLTTETIVYVYESASGSTAYVPYIYVGLDSSGKARLLRRKCLRNNKRLNGTSVADYAGTEMDIWLNDAESGFLARLDEATRAALTETSIAYSNYSSGSAVIDTISRKVYLPSRTELGWDAIAAGSEGASFGLSGRSAKADDSTSSAVTYWTRSANSTTKFLTNSSTGNSNSAGATGASGIRPVLSFDPTTAVSDEGSPNITLLPGSHEAFWEFTLTVWLGDTSARAKKAKLFFPGNIPMLTVQMCNNYKDSSPTWEDTDSDHTVEFANTTKTNETWSLGAKITARSYDSTETLGEPAAIVEFDEEEQGA